jgi:hypothetical protein
VEYREGGDIASGMRKRRVTHSDFVLKWGVTTSREPYDCHLAVINGGVARENTARLCCSTPKARKPCARIFPGPSTSKRDGARLNAMSNDVAIEALTFTCELQVQA